MTKIKEVKSVQEYTIAINLFQEYASQIGIDLSFQNFEQELIEIEKQYSRPKGIIFIAFNNEGQPIGCFGIKQFTPSVCELKRMHLKPKARGKGIGKQLLLKVIKTGKELNYITMRLDTLPTMQTTIKLYQEVGFYEIDAYRFNPFAGAKFFEIPLE